MLFPAALILAMPFSYTKGWPLATQVVFIAGSLAILSVLTLALALAGKL